MRNKSGGKERLGAIGLAILTAAVAAAILFLAGPTVILPRHEYARYEDVDASGWQPAQAIGFWDVDSIARRGSRPQLCIRYSSEARGELGLQLMSVLSDGSVMCDTLSIRLRDRYGNPEGEYGYGVNELLYPFGWQVDVDECRLLEIAPVSTAKGICSVGLIIENDMDNEISKPLTTKESGI